MVNFTLQAIPNLSSNQKKGSFELFEVSILQQSGVVTRSQQRLFLTRQFHEGRKPSSCGGSI